MTDYKSTIFTEDQNQWIAQEDAISREESLIIAIEAQTAAIEAQTEAIKDLAKTNARLADSNEYQAEQIENLINAIGPCDFTGWNLSEAISNLTLKLREDDAN